MSLNSNQFQNNANGIVNSIAKSPSLEWKDSKMIFFPSSVINSNGGLYAFSMFNKVIFKAIRNSFPKYILFRYYRKQK